MPGMAIGLAAVVVAALFGTAASAPSDDKIFTVGNYPVEAKAANAVAAKEKALADGQQAAFRSLLKRLVPVGAYMRLAPLRNVKAADLIAGFSVRSERNSTTEYIASYDFSFQAEAVRALLEREGVPFADRQAEPLTLVPIYRPPAAGAGASNAFSEASGSDTWLYAWKALDIANSLTPIALKPLDARAPTDTIKAAVDGDASAARTLAPENRNGLVVVALLEPDPTGKRVHVTMAGRDAAGPFRLARPYRLDGDLTYTAELAAVISLGIIEGRWKAVSVRGDVRSGAGGPTAAVAADTIRIAVQFSNMAEWQVISRQLSGTPDVSDLEVEGLSARGARLALRYPGGPERLASSLADQGLVLRNSGGGWVLSSR
jgi:hypothetical protein